MTKRADLPPEFLAAALDEALAQRDTLRAQNTDLLAALERLVADLHEEDANRSGLYNEQEPMRATFRRMEGIAQRAIAAARKQAVKA